MLETISSHLNEGVKESAEFAGKFEATRSSFSDFFSYYIAEVTCLLSFAVLASRSNAPVKVNPDEWGLVARLVEK